MFPEVWGPHAWIFLHTITFNYPSNPSNEDKRYHKELFENLKYTLPCKKCAKHYSENLLKYPIDSALDSREKFIEWLIDIHNEVNKKNGKRIYSYEEVHKIYYDMFDVKSSKNNINKIILLIILFIVLFYIYKNYSDYFLKLLS